MRSVRVRHYLQRATDFFDCMQLTRDDESFRNSSALLAIHSAVSFCDALRAGLGDRELSSDNHNQAADALSKQIPSGVRLDPSGLDHLRYLISRKTAMAYGERRVEEKTFGLVVLRSERFAAWANDTGKRLGIEGWHDGNG